MGGLVMMGGLHPAQWKQLPYTISKRFRILGGGRGKVQGSIGEHFALFDKQHARFPPHKKLVSARVLADTRRAMSCPLIIADLIPASFGERFIGT